MLAPAASLFDQTALLERAERLVKAARAAGADTADAVLQNWEKLKAEERKGKNEGALSGVPKSLPALLKAILLIAVELMVVTAIALFFSTFSSPLLSAALTFGLSVAGRFNADLRNMDQIVESRPAVLLARAAYHVLPDFAAFDVKTEVVHGLPVAWGYVAATAGYGALYIAALLAASAAIFSRRDFK